MTHMLIANTDSASNDFVQKLFVDPFDSQEKFMVSTLYQFYRNLGSR